MLIGRLGDLDFGDLPGRRAADPFAAADAGEVTVRLVRVAPGPRAPHVHPDSLEVTHVVGGTGRHYQGNRFEAVRPGDTILVPAGVPHATVADEPLLLVCFFPHPDPFSTTTELPGELV